MRKLITRIKTYLKNEQSRCTKLKAMFRPGQRVQCLSSGQIFFVAGAEPDLGFAILRDIRGNHHAVSWLSGAQTVKTHMADQWNPVLQ